MQIESQIREVTVYTDRALVTRQAEAQLAPGTYKLRVGGLPTHLQADSLRVRGEGEAEVILHGLDLVTAYSGQGSSQRAADLEAMLQAIADEERSLTDSQAIQQGKLAALQQTMAHAPGSFAHQVAEGRSKLGEWEDTLAFLETQQTRAAAALLQLEQKRRELAERRRQVEAELNKLRSFQGPATYEAVVSVEVLSEGGLTLTVEYVIGGASWSPAYDARLSQAGDRLDWRYYGLVRQQTGEHWENVHLKLSTARPAESSRPPQLSDWYLSVYHPLPPMAQAAPAPGGYGQYEGAPPPPPSPAPAARMAQAPQALVSQQGTSVTMEVARPLTIPSNGEPHQAPVGQLELVPTLKYFVIPKLAPHVYLEAELTYDGAWPLLAGPVKAFVGQDYVGTIPLNEEVMPGQSFSLPMGVDRALQVERKRLKKNEGEGGLLKKERFAEYRYEVVLTSYKEAPQRVTLIEQVPRATQEEIKVKLGDMSASARQDEPGKLSWEVQLVPRESQKLTWGYRVEYPTSVTVTGLE